MLAMFLVQWMASHLYLVFTGYSILNVIVCFALTKRKRYCGIKAAVSFIGNYMCFLSFAYIMLGYAVPYVIVNDKSFSSFFEFVVTLLLGTGGIAIVQFFNYYHGKAVLEFVLGILFLGLVLVFLKYGAGNISAVESLTQIYGVKTAQFLVALFGLIG